MPTHPDGSMEIKMCKGYRKTLRVFGMFGVCSGQCCFVLFVTQEIDDIDFPVLLNELGEVTVEGMLGCLRSCDLDTLSEGLESLLFPEYCGCRRSRL